MRISSTHAYVLGFSCLLQFGDGKKKHKCTQKLQLEVCSGPEAVRVQTEQTAQAPTLAPPGDKGQVSRLSFGDNTSTCLRGGWRAHEMIMHEPCLAQGLAQLRHGRCH